MLLNLVRTFVELFGIPKMILQQDSILHSKLSKGGNES